MLRHISISLVLACFASMPFVCKSMEQEDSAHQGVKRSRSSQINENKALDVVAQLIASFKEKAEVPESLGEIADTLSATILEAASDEHLLDTELFTAMVLSSLQQSGFEITESTINALIDSDEEKNEPIEKKSKHDVVDLTTNATSEWKNPSQDFVKDLIDEISKLESLSYKSEGHDAPSLLSKIIEDNDIATLRNLKTSTGQSLWEYADLNGKKNILALLKKKLNKSPDSQECCVCFEENKKHKFTSYQCLHSVCADCFPKIDKCPICRNS